MLTQPLVTHLRVKGARVAFTISFFIHMVESLSSAGTAPLLAAHTQFQVVLLLLLAVLLLLCDLIPLAVGLTLPRTVEFVSMSPTMTHK